MVNAGRAVCIEQVIDVCFQLFLNGWLSISGECYPEKKNGSKTTNIHFRNLIILAQNGQQNRQ